MYIYYVLLPAVCTLVYNLQFKELYLMRAAYEGNLYFKKPKFYLLLLIRIQTLEFRRKIQSIFVMLYKFINILIKYQKPSFW